MGRPRRQYIKKNFESTGASNDTSANVYVSMLMSDAWKELTANQQRLYVYCKAQYYAEKSKPDGDPLQFTMNRSKWADLYGLYDRGNAKGFYRDMRELCNHGFIICVSSGQCTRTKSIYRFSDMWQKYGTEEFKPPVGGMSSERLPEKNEGKKEIPW